MHYIFPVVISMVVAGFGAFSHLESSRVGEDELTGVLDRIEDRGQAVILVEAIEKEWVVPMDILPPGSKVNMWFDVEINEDELEVLRMNHDATKQTLEKVREGQRKLKRGPRVWAPLRWSEKSLPIE